MKTVESKALALAARAGLLNRAARAKRDAAVRTDMSDPTSEPLFEQLETRSMLAATFANPIQPLVVNANTNPVTIALANRAVNPSVTGTVVTFTTSLGNFNVELFDRTGPGRARSTPQTVANFLNYVNNNRYVNNIVHRSARYQDGSPFVIQGGGFTLPTGTRTSQTNPQDITGVPAAIQTFNPVTNEPGNSNVRGTIALARVGGSINSGTSQWFINTNNSNTFLDTVDQGFTAFGRVLGSGMTVVDAIQAVPFFDGRGFYTTNPTNTFSGAAGELPLRNIPNPVPDPLVVAPENFVNVSSIATRNDIIYEVTTSNANLVTATITNGNLVLTPQNNQTGTANIRLRAISADGTQVDNTFTFRVNAPPTTGTLTVNPGTITRGTPVTFSLANVADTDGTISRVEFFRDTSGTGVFNPSTVVSIGNGTRSGTTSNWTFTPSSTLAFPTGNITFFARALDSNGAFSTVQNVPLQINNAPPVITSLASSTTLLLAPGANIVLTPNGARDPDGTLTEVDFYRDGGDGIFNFGQQGSDDVLIGTRTPAQGLALTFSTANLTRGISRFFAVATDSSNATSAAAQVDVRINRLPTIQTFTVTPSPTQRGNTVTLTASDVIDPDGTISTVRFFRARTAGGAFSATANQLLGVGVRQANTNNWVLTVPSTGFLAGDNTFYVQATDNNTGLSDPSSALATITNRLPTIASLTGPAVLNAGVSFTLTPNGVADPDGTVSRVNFYQDGGDGVFTFGQQGSDDTLLGFATAATGFRLTTTVNVLNPGAIRLFAQALDNDNGLSATAPAFNTRVNSPIEVSGVQVTPEPVARLSTVTMVAVGLTDADPNGRPARVEFYRARTPNGPFSTTANQFLGLASRVGTTDNWTITVSTAGWLADQNDVYVRVIDNEGGIGPVFSRLVTVTNLNPTLASLTVLPPISNRNQNITLTGNGAADRDGTIDRIRYFRDGGDGVFTFGQQGSDDVLIGERTRQQGFTLTTLVPSNQAFGTARYFAVAVDSDGGVSASVTATNTVNIPPAIGTFTTSAGANAIARLGTALTLTATGITDTAPGTITRVDFFRARTAQGAFDAVANQLLGVGVRTTGTDTWTFRLADARGFLTGTNTLYVRATDNNGGFTVQSATVTITNVAPPVPTLSVTPALVANLGDNITLTATNVRDLDGTVSRVVFFRDIDGDGQLDTNVDPLIGQATAAQSFRITIPTTGFGFDVGTNRYFACTIDNDDDASLPATVTNVINTPPTVGSVTGPASVTRPSTVTLVATNVADTAPGTVASVQFFVDTNTNGVLDAGDRLLGNGARVPNTNNWTITAATTAADPFGTGIKFFARAVDNNGGRSVPRSVDIDVNNALPTVTSVAAAPAIVSQLGGNVTLTIAGQRDVDGTVASVRYFVDTDSNGQFDPNTDTLIATATAAQSFRSVVATTSQNGFAVGINRVFAVVRDNSGGDSAAAVTTTFRINAAPTIGTFTSNPANTIQRAQPFTLTAGAVTDSDGTIASVQFFRARNVADSFNPATAILIGTGARVTNTNDWRVTLPGTTLPLGQVKLFVRVTDNNGGITINEITVTVA